MIQSDTQTHAQLRSEIDRLLAIGEAQRALSQMRKLWSVSPDSISAGYINARAGQLRGKVELTSSRVAILRSFTVEPMVPMVRAGALTGGIDVEVHLGEFNAYAQEIIDPGSALYRFDPNVVFLAVRGADLASDLYTQHLSLDAQSAEAMVERTLADILGWILILRQRTNATIVVHGFEIPELPASGLLDAQCVLDAGASSQANGQKLGNSQADAIRQINRRIAQAVQQHTGVYLLDYDALVSRHGKRQWFDAQKWLTVRLPISAPNLRHMSAEWVRFLHPASGKLIKCLVCDLDNTLWGGVVGEDGVTGIKLDSEYPGAAYVSLQRAILDMHGRGVILAINSKNNEADAMEVIKDHPRMLLRPEHFAIRRINWQDKATNLREIAAELNIGIDSLAFIDDNPVERQWVREHAPEVTVIELPTNALDYARVLRETPGLERLTLSEEDKSRGRFYTEDRMREDLRLSAGSMDDFYKSLKMEAKIGRVNAETLARVSQLTQKTNQFNLSTKRYNEAQISTLGSSAASQVYWMAVKDRFGDNGLIAVGILHFKDEVCDLDTLLMSCRVIGRGVETAFLAFLVDVAQRAGCKELHAEYRTTNKNAPVKDFLPHHHFKQISGDGTCGTWSLGLAGTGPSWPEYIGLFGAPDDYSERVALVNSKG